MMNSVRGIAAAGARVANNAAPQTRKVLASTHSKPQPMPLANPPPAQAKQQVPPRPGGRDRRVSHSEPRRRSSQQPQISLGGLQNTQGREGVPLVWRLVNASCAKLTAMGFANDERNMEKRLHCKSMLQVIQNLSADMQRQKRANAERQRLAQQQMRSQQDSNQLSDAHSARHRDSASPSPSYVDSRSPSPRTSDSDDAQLVAVLPPQHRTNKRLSSPSTSNEGKKSTKGMNKKEKKAYEKELERLKLSSEGSKGRRTSAVLLDMIDNDELTGNNSKPGRKKKGAMGDSSKPSPTKVKRSIFARLKRNSSATPAEHRYSDA